MILGAARHISMDGYIGVPVCDRQGRAATFDVTIATAEPAKGSPPEVLVEDAQTDFSNRCI